MADNPFFSAMQQLKKAAAVAGLNQQVVGSLQKPQRILEASLPVVMDDGTTKNFTAFRVQYN
ncbi:MAG: glutamate dehydrogenase, partial [Patescibacteria group bacterium]